MSSSAVGTLVIFAPYDAPEVGVYDATTKTFSTTAATGMTSGTYRYCIHVAITYARTYTHTHTDTHTHTHSTHMLNTLKHTHTYSTHTY